MSDKQDKRPAGVDSLGIGPAGVIYPTDEEWAEAEDLVGAYQQHYYMPGLQGRIAAAFARARMKLDHKHADELAEQASRLFAFRQKEKDDEIAKLKATLWEMNDVCKCLIDTMKRVLAHFGHLEP